MGAPADVDQAPPALRDASGAVEYCRSSHRSLERRTAEVRLTRYTNSFRVLV